MNDAPIRFVLFEPTHPGNIGSVARAMKTMGFHELVLVNPPEEWLCAESRAMASGAQDVLHAARRVGSLAEAVGDCGLVVGASARFRRLNTPELDPRECAAAVTAAAASRPAALVFGPERSGLSNAELDLCHAIVYIPGNPDYNSLNLSQAVQVIAYELRQLERYERPLPPPESPPARPGDMELFYRHLEHVLLGCGFLNPDNPRHLMRRLRRLFNRARLDDNELNIMRGILSALVPGSGSAAAADERPARSLYLDHAASTPVASSAAAVMTRILNTRELAASPSSVHAPGRAAAAALEEARAQVAGLIGARPRELVFTSGATEANNLALLGAAAFYEAGGRHLVSSLAEHASVVEPLRRLEAQGFSVTWLPTGADGLVDPEEVRRALRPDTVLVSLTLLNNEIGVLQDIAAIGALCRAHGARLHVDAAQAAGRVPIDVRVLPVDLMSLSAHKLYGPAGIGALYLNAERCPRVQPLLHGGGQERGLRPGTVPLHLAAGFGEACRLAGERLAADARHVRVLHERLWSRLSPLPGVTLNGHSGQRSFHILNASVEGVDGDSLHAALGELAVSRGSACASALAEPSKVLRLLGRPAALARSSVRFSFGRGTTPADVDKAAALFADAVERLRRRSPAAVAGMPPAALDGEAGSAEAGAWVRCRARLEGDRMRDVQLYVQGPPALMTLCAMLGERLEGQPPSALAAPDLAPLARAAGLPPERASDLFVVEDALRNCLADWENSRLLNSPSARN